MFTINTIVRPNANADREYSICGNSVLQKAKVVKTFNRQANGNNMTIEVLEHNNPAVIGKKYKVDDRYFEAVQQEFKKYDYNFSNRFFKVKALVKATDYEHRNPNNTVLVAKAIRFETEVTYDPATIEAKRNSMQ